MNDQPPRNDETPSDEAILRMLSRMHNTAAASDSEYGAHASSAQHDQLAAKYRNAADEERDR